MVGKSADGTSVKGEGASAGRGAGTRKKKKARPLFKVPKKKPTKHRPSDVLRKLKRGSVSNRTSNLKIVMKERENALAKKLDEFQQSIAAFASVVNQMKTDIHKLTEPRHGFAIVQKIQQMDAVVEGDSKEEEVEDVVEEDSDDMLSEGLGSDDDDDDEFELSENDELVQRAAHKPPAVVWRELREMVVRVIDVDTTKEVLDHCMEKMYELSDLAVSTMEESADTRLRVERMEQGLLSTVNKMWLVNKCSLSFGAARVAEMERMRTANGMLPLSHLRMTLAPHQVVAPRQIRMHDFTDSEARLTVDGILGSVHNTAVRASTSEHENVRRARMNAAFLRQIGNVRDAETIEARHLSRAPLKTGAVATAERITELSDTVRAHTTNDLMDLNDEERRDALNTFLEMHASTHPTESWIKAPPSLSLPAIAKHGVPGVADNENSLSLAVDAGNDLAGHNSILGVAALKRFKADTGRGPPPPPPPPPPTSSPMTSLPAAAGATRGSGGTTDPGTKKGGKKASGGGGRKRAPKKTTNASSSRSKLDTGTTSKTMLTRVARKDRVPVTATSAEWALKTKHGASLALQQDPELAKQMIAAELSVLENFE